MYHWSTVSRKTTRMIFNINYSIWILGSLYSALSVLTPLSQLSLTWPIKKCPRLTSDFVLFLMGWSWPLTHTYHDLVMPNVHMYSIYLFHPHLIEMWYDCPHLWLYSLHQWIASHRKLRFQAGFVWIWHCSRFHLRTALNKHNGNVVID